MIASSRRTLLPWRPLKVISIWWFVAIFVLLWALSLIFRFGITVLSGFSLLILLGILMSRFERQRIRKIAGERREESICSFAKAFDCHKIDTRIVRAVYEELQNHFSTDAPSFPIRAADSFENDLKLDWEDLDDIAHEIAARTQRSLDGCEQNPLYDKVKTVADLVLFFTHQPLAQNPSQ